MGIAGGLHLFALLFSSAPPTPDAASSGFSIAVMHIKAEKGVDPAAASVLTDLVTQALRDTGIFTKVINSKEIEALVTREMQTQAMGGCESDSCLAEIVGGLGADYLLLGSAYRLEDGYMVTLRMMDSARGVVLASVSDRITGTTEKDLLDGMEAATGKVVKGMGLNVASAPPRALVPAATAQQPWVSPKLLTGILGVGASVPAALVALGVLLLGGVLLVLPYAVVIETGAVHGAPRGVLLTVLPSAVMLVGAVLGALSLAVLSAGGVGTALALRSAL